MKIQEIDYSINLKQAVITQYGSADNLRQIVEKKQQWYDANQTQFWQDWFNDVFNLATANNFGMSVWCIILGLPYLIKEPGDIGPVWGFNEIPQVNDNKNFSHGNFADHIGKIALEPEDQRIFLQLRYYQLTSRGDRLTTNQALDRLFNNPDGPYQGGAWMIDNLDMTIDYVFNCGISQGLLNALIVYDVLPRPAAVKITNYIAT